MMPHSGTSAQLIAIQRFFDDLIHLVDPDEELPYLRPEVENLRYEVLFNGGAMFMTAVALKSFITGLMAAGRLSPSQADWFLFRIENGAGAFFTFN